MQDSIFTKIIKGEIPCHKIYEDELSLAFLDINPINPGHTLVIPKEQIDELWDVNDELYQHLMKIVSKIAKRQRDILHPKRVGIVVEGFEVPHAHVHVFPLHEDLRHTLTNHGTTPVAEPDHTALAEIAKKLAF